MVPTLLSSSLNIWLLDQPQIPTSDPKARGRCLSLSGAAGAGCARGGVLGGRGVGLEHRGPLPGGPSLRSPLPSIFLLLGGALQRLQTVVHVSPRYDCYWQMCSWRTVTLPCLEPEVALNLQMVIFQTPVHVIRVPMCTRFHINGVIQSTLFYSTPFPINSYMGVFLG